MTQQRIVKDQSNQGQSTDKDRFKERAGKLPSKKMDKEDELQLLREKSGF